MRVRTLRLHEKEKSVKGRFDHISAQSAIFGVTSMSRKPPKMLPQCRRGCSLNVEKEWCDASADGK